MIVNRTDFLVSIQSVFSGLSNRDVIEQSSCFVFQDEKVYTYNDEISCCVKLETGFEGAVQAKPLMDILKKLVEEEVQLTTQDGELIISGKGRKAGIRLEAEILLPIDSIEKPDEWKNLHEDFTEAVSIVQECAGKDASKFILTCVHLHPNWIEAFDNIQLTRYKIKTGVEKPTLVKRDAIKHIVSLDMTEISETPHWIHFKNPGGLILSCRRYVEDYVDLSDLLKVKGTPTILPKGLVEAAEKAEVFSMQNPESNSVRVDIKKGKIRIKGEGSAGWYSEIKKVQYEGQPLSFSIAPKLLMALVKKYTECQIAEGRLKVDGGAFRYVTCLEAV